MSTIRKHATLSATRARVVREAAVRRGCSEAEVIRSAIDALGTPLQETDHAARASIGRLTAPSAEPDALTWDDEEDDAELSSAEIDALEREYDAWLRTLPGPLYLSEAVLEDRR